MRSIYTYKAQANENHIQTYAIYQRFGKLVRERGLKQQSYELNAAIDGNVTEWKAQTNSDDVAKAVQEAFDLLNLTEKEVDKAISAVARKNQWKYKVLDMNKLVSTLRKVKIVTKRPKVDNDEMESKTIKFWR